MIVSNEVGLLNHEEEINTCFAEMLKKMRIALYYEDKEEHKIFIIYNQGAWRIAYFEDDRELMGKILAEPAMQETIKRQLGDFEPSRNAEGHKRWATLSPFMRRSGATGSASSLP